MDRKLTGKLKRAAVLLLCSALLLSLAACSGKPVPEDPDTIPRRGSVVRDVALVHEPEFGGVYITLTIDEFNALGFSYGDSVSITFSNGYELTGIPYYNGYYTDNGEPLLIAYPGYDYIKAAINNGADLWTEAGLGETDSADVSLEKRGAYLEIQHARDIHYTDEISDYPNETVFANLRNITAGRIREGVLYRSASPCDNQHNRAPYVDRQIRRIGIRSVVDLADTAAKIDGYIGKEDFSSDYFLTLYQSGGVLPVGLNMNFESDEFRTKVADALIWMSESDGPYLVHCTEGKDRTGFVCMLIEALCGASYREIADDYMITYANYYKLTERSDKERYDVIVAHVLDPMIRSMAGSADADPQSIALSVAAESFLLDSGMTAEQITALREKLTDEQTAPLHSRVLGRTPG